MLRIGLAQMDIKLGDREANFAAVEEWMKKYWTPSETETAVVLPDMMYIAACNRVGDTPSDSFPGYSAVIDPWGAPLCEAAEAPFGAFVEIEPRKAEEARRFIKALEMRRPELYKL